MNAKLRTVLVPPLWISLGLAAAVLSLHALLANTLVETWIAQTSPLGPASWFSVSSLCLIILQSTFRDPTTTPVKASYAWVGAALLSIAAVFAFNLNSPFLSDDYILVRAPAPTLARFAASLRTVGGDGGFRPLGYLYFSVVHLWAGYSPLRWHLLGLALHLLSCLALYIVVWLLWRDTLLAVIAVLIFGLNGTRPEAVTWTAGSFDLLAALFTLASLAALLSPMRRGISWPLGLLLMIAAILSKESAYAYPALLMGFTWAAGRANRWTFRYTALATFVCGSLFVYRWHLFGGPGGYVHATTGRPQILSLSFISTAKALLSRIWAILMFPINWEAGMSIITRLAIPLGCLTLIILVAHAKWVSRRTALALFGTVILSVVPAVHLALIGSSDLGSRILYLPGAGFAILLAILAGAARRRAVLLVGLALFMVVITLHNLAAWKNAALMADRVCTSAAQSTEPPDASSVPPTRDGVYFFQNGFQACLAMKAELGDR